MMMGTFIQSASKLCNCGERTNFSTLWLGQMPAVFDVLSSGLRVEVTG
jgi:hypothetical protein